MTQFAADQLRGRIERGHRWPIDWEREIRGKILLWQAFRESDERVLRKVSQWRSDRTYYIDPLPAKLPEAWGSMLWGEEPEIRPGDDQDADRLAAMIEANQLVSSFQEGEVITASEGEAWWRITVNLNASDHALLSWHSRADVVPLLHGRKVVAAAFVSRLYDPGGAPDAQVVYRHVEIQSAGRVENWLYVGRKDALGGHADLARHPETEGLNPVWETGVPAPLAGRITNKLGRSPYAGISDYEGIWTQFLLLNEATTIGRENMRLTAKKRAVLPASAVRARQPGAPVDLVDRGDGSMVPATPRGSVDVDEDVLVADPLDVDEGGGGANPFRILEYSFDAAALVEYLRYVTETICIRSDIVPQFIGQGDFGQGNTGTALRVRLLPTLNAAESKARPWADQAPRILALMAILEKNGQAYGGVGRTDWVAPATPPTIQRATPLPQDPVDEAHVHATLATAHLQSIDQSLRERHPDWDEDQRNAERDAIRADLQDLAPEATFPAGGDDDPPPPAPGSGG